MLKSFPLRPKTKTVSIPPRSLILSSIAEKKAYAEATLKSYIYWIFPLFIILILDSLLKFELGMRKGLTRENYVVHLLQLIVYASITVISLLIEFFRQSHQLLKSKSFNDLFYVSCSLIFTVGIIEERLYNSQENFSWLLEGWKVSMVQIVLIPIFKEERIIVVTYLLNIVYISGRLNEQINENSVSFWALVILLNLQIIKGMQPLPNFQNFFTRLQKDLSNTGLTRKNITTFLEENEFETEDVNYLFETLLNNSSDGFILFDHKKEIIFNNLAINYLFPDFSSDLKTGLLSLKVQDLEAALVKAVEENRPKPKKNHDYQNVFQIKINSNILSSISSYTESSDTLNKQNTLKMVLDALTVNRYSIFRAVNDPNANKLVKVKEHRFCYKISEYQESNPYNLGVGEISVFCYKNKKIFLICFKRDIAITKILDGFKKVIDYISSELTNSLNDSLMMLQLLQSSSLMPQKLISDFVNPALVSTKFLINLKTEMTNVCEVLQGKISKNLIDFNLKDLANEALQMFSFQCESKCIDFSLKYDERIPKIINSDPRLIMQIIATLIKNSIKMSFKNSIFVKVEMEEATLLRITVSDSGSGLSKEEKLKYINTFNCDDYFTNFNFDPFNIGYDLFVSHLLALILCPENSYQKGLNLVTEQGAGCSLSFLVQDMGEFENLRDIGEDELNYVHVKMGEFNLSNLSENKFIKKDEFSRKNLTRPSVTKENSNFAPKSPKNFSCINPKPKQNFDLFLRNNSLKNEQNEECKTYKNTLHEFSKNDEHTFTLTPSIQGEGIGNEVESVAMDNLPRLQNLSLSGNPHSLLLPKSPEHRHSTSGKSKDFGANIENNISSITCSKMGTDMVWSFSSDSNIWKEISDVNIFEDKLRQIKELNKFKKCSCTDILIIDHDEMSNYALKLILGWLGFATESCPISLLAIQKVAKKIDEDCCKIFKMIFISNDLPAISGHEACRRIVKLYSDLNMFIPALIALANKMSEQEQKEIKKAGFSDFICKPIMQNTIHFYVKKYLSVDLVKKKINIVQN